MVFNYQTLRCEILKSFMEDAVYDLTEILNDL